VIAGPTSNSGSLDRTPNKRCKRLETRIWPSHLENLTTGGVSPCLGLVADNASSPPVSWKFKHVLRITCFASGSVKNFATTLIRVELSSRGLTLCNRIT